MHAQPAYLTFLFSIFAVLAFAQDDDMPECVASCIDENPTSSFCDGDETGSDLDECMCASFSGSLMIECINDCPQDEKEVFAAELPAVCRESLLPGVSADDNESTSGTSTDTATATATVTEGSDEPTQTDENASENTESDEPDLAVGHDLPGLLAVGGLVVAFFL